MADCKHTWEYLNYKSDKNLVFCANCGLTREICNYCENGQPFYSNYSVFDFSLNSKGNLDISSEHNDYDEMKILYCPMCGKKLECD